MIKLSKYLWFTAAISIAISLILMHIGIESGPSPKLIVVYIVCILSISFATSCMTARDYYPQVRRASNILLIVTIIAYVIAFFIMWSKIAMFIGLVIGSACLVYVLVRISKG